MLWRRKSILGSRFVRGKFRFYWQNETKKDFICDFLGVFVFWTACLWIELWMCFLALVTYLLLLSCSNDSIFVYLILNFLCFPRHRLTAWASVQISIAKWKCLVGDFFKQEFPYQLCFHIWNVLSFNVVVCARGSSEFTVRSDDSIFFVHSAIFRAKICRGICL